MMDFGWWRQACSCAANTQAGFLERMTAKPFAIRQFGEVVFRAVLVSREQRKSVTD
jgi:hypothetical protein